MCAPPRDTRQLARSGFPLPAVWMLMDGHIRAHTPYLVSPLLLLLCTCMAYVLD